MDTVAELTSLRQEIERETGVAVTTARASVACVLYDVAQALDLPAQEILGDEAFDALTNGQVQEIVHSVHDCPFGDPCDEPACLLEDCPTYGDRWSFVIGFGLEDPLGQAADDSA